MVRINFLEYNDSGMIPYSDEHNDLLFFFHEFPLVDRLIYAIYPNSEDFVCACDNRDKSSVTRIWEDGDFNRAKVVLKSIAEKRYGDNCYITFCDITDTTVVVRKRRREVHVKKINSIIENWF